MSNNFIRTLAVALALSLVPVAIIAPSVGAWDAKVKQCEEPGQSSQVFNGESGYQMLLFRDGMQPRYSFGYGWNEVPEGGEYLVRWAKDGEFHPHTDNVWVKECPPVQPKPPEVDWTATCVNNAKGNQVVLELTTSYDTNGPELTLFRNIRVDGTFLGLPSKQVQGDDQLVTRRWIGTGDFVVKGSVELGDKKVYHRYNVSCAPQQIVEPSARILQPCADPMGGGLFNNRQSTRPVTFLLETAETKNNRSWSTLVKKMVQGGDYFVTRAYYLEPESWVRIRRGNGEVLAIEQVADAGYYGWGSWECRVLENRAYLND